VFGADFCFFAKIVTNTICALGLAMCRGSADK